MTKFESPSKMKKAFAYEPTEANETFEEAGDPVDAIKLSMT